MKIEEADVSTLVEDPANARLHSEKNIEAIAGSLRRFGQQKPIVVDRDGVVRAGNGTLVAAKRLGWEKIQVLRTELSGVDATAYAIADNRSSELGEWDRDALVGFLREFPSDLSSDIGFDEFDLKKLMGETEPPRDFETIGEDLHTDFKCPKCGYEWSGGAK